MVFTYRVACGKQHASQERQFSLQRERAARWVPQTAGQRPPRDQGTLEGKGLRTVRRVMSQRAEPTHLDPARRKT